VAQLQAAAGAGWFMPGQASDQINDRDRQSVADAALMLVIREPRTDEMAADAPAQIVPGHSEMSSVE